MFPGRALQKRADSEYGVQDGVVSLGCVGTCALGGFTLNEE